MNLVALCLWAFAALPSTSRLGPAPKPPAQLRRVVTLAPSLTDVVVGLGAADRLVGVSRYDERAEVSSLPRVGGFSDPSVEAVFGLRPDLLLVQPGPGNRKPVERLAALGIPVLAVPLENVQNVSDALRSIGQLLGKSEQGEALAARIDRTRTEVRSAVAQLPKVRTLVVYGFDPLVVAGPGSFADELLKDAGGENVVKPPAGPYTVYSVESALRAKPDVVINSAFPETGAEKLQKLPGLSGARWVKLPGSELLHPGPGLARGLRNLADVLHPRSREIPKPTHGE